MSIIGLAARPGIAVDPMWWIPPLSQAASTASNSARSASNRSGQSGSYGVMTTGLRSSSTGREYPASGSLDGRFELWGTQTRPSPRLAPSPAEPAFRPETPGSRSRAGHFSGSAAPRTSVLPGGGRRCLYVPLTGYTARLNSNREQAAWVLAILEANRRLAQEAG